MSGSPKVIFFSLKIFMSFTRGGVLYDGEGRVGCADHSEYVAVTGQLALFPPSTLSSRDSTQLIRLGTMHYEPFHQPYIIYIILLYS